MIIKNSKISQKEGQEKRLETLGTKTRKQKLEFLEHLAKSSIVQLACERGGIGRSTYYDWRKKDKTFAQKADKAIIAGSLLVNDIAESQLLRAIQSGNMTGIIFWLKNHHHSYNDKIHHEHELVVNEIDPEHRIAIAKALFNSGQLTKYGRNSMIKSAGGIPPPDIPGEDDLINKVMSEVEKREAEMANELPSPNNLKKRLAPPEEKPENAKLAEFLKQRRQSMEKKKNGSKK
ncbi:MAG: hypothetical protein NT098_02410 [Candidatus Parcubacteria bacterium]|nr:hypothetical protein [Candidatus Parcubacteria bacterium]